MPAENKIAYKYRNDESVVEDTLDREQYAKVLAKLVTECETPIVVGIYGKWGVGKSSLMKLIEQHIPDRDARKIWFDPWQYQFNDEPLLAFVQTLYDSFDDKLQGEVKKLVMVIGAAVISGVTKALSTIDIKDIKELGEMYEDERFLTMERQVRLKHHFEQLVDKARIDGAFKKKLVFFIDDLDRCMPAQALKMIEALKLYLNITGCIFFLGVDKDALSLSIQHHYHKLSIKGQDYLDKIIQLPFNVPPIERACMANYVDPLLPEQLKSCLNYMVSCMGDNPRKIKRFINTLVLHFELIKEIDFETNVNIVKVLALILLIQELNEPIYKELVKDPRMLRDLKNDPDGISASLNKHNIKNDCLLDIFEDVDLPDEVIVRKLIYVTTTTTREEIDITQPSRLLSAQVIDFMMLDHRNWLESLKSKGQKADFSFCILKGIDFAREKLSEANLEGANLESANLRGIDLEKANLINANLLRSILGAANLSYAKLKGADLRYAQLDGANLSHTDLVGASLVRTSLKGANLKMADLRGANLKDANLTDANLTGAKIIGANLQGTIYEFDLPEGVV